MDLTAAAGARATRMSRLRAGDAADGRGQERRCATGPTTTRLPGAGRRVSPGARASECSASQLDAAGAGTGWVFIILTSLSFFLGQSDCSSVWGLADSN